MSCSQSRGRRTALAEDDNGLDALVVDCFFERGDRPFQRGSCSDKGGQVDLAIRDQTARQREIGWTRPKGPQQADLVVMDTAEVNQRRNAGWHAGKNINDATWFGKSKTSCHRIWATDTDGNSGRPAAYVPKYTVHDVVHPRIEDDVCARPGKGEAGVGGSNQDDGRGAVKPANLYVELAHRTVTEHEERIPTAKVQGVKTVDDAGKGLNKGPNCKLHVAREPDKALLHDRARDPNHLGEASRLRPDLHEMRAQCGSFGEALFAYAAWDIRGNCDAIAHPPPCPWPIAAVRYSA